jgi:2-methylisocitrate lyase-like PEP mutase family enzyme
MEDVPTHLDKSRLFRTLHVPGSPLVLPNAWDPVSARIVANAGARAIATTSAGVAWSLGYGDGDHLPRELAVEAVARIVSAVEVPVSADIERGFGATAADVAETVRAICDAGAVGVNLEDSLRPVEEQGERLAAARQAADEAGLHLFVNARIDTHRLGTGDEESWLEETLRRALAYVDAGADGIFVLGAPSPAAVRTLVTSQPLPVNVAVDPGTSPVALLAEAGAARISAGSSIAEAAYGLVDRAARELLDAGTTTELEGRLSYGSLNALFLAEPGTDAADGTA